MSQSALQKPNTDPTPIFEHFRNGFATDLLTVACVDFDIFSKLSKSPMTFAEVCKSTGLSNRAANVLMTALRSMDMIVVDSEGKFCLSPISAEHLVSGGYFDVGGYVSLVAEAPSVRAIAERLKTNKPAENRKEDTGAAFIFRPGLESAMDQSDSARRLTMALAGRAKNVAPYLADAVDFSNSKTLLDIGGGTGIYAIACLQKNTHLKGIVWDRPQVLKVAAEMADEYGVKDRLQLIPGDMFTDSVPDADVMLMSNILHDWDEPECLKLMKRCAEKLPSGGRILVHDAFLKDDLSGPFALAMYSTALFTLTEGRAYSAEEYRRWMLTVGLKPKAQLSPTLVHCAVLEGVK